MSELIKVGIADLKVAVAPDMIISYALGSCVGICLYDNLCKVAGLAHILLPQKNSNDGNLMKYADTAVPLLIYKMEELNAKRYRMTAKIAGGANMFETISTSFASQIGIRNILAVKEILNKCNIRIIGEDTGGNYGRTIQFNPENGMLFIKSLSHTSIEI